MSKKGAEQRLEEQAASFLERARNLDFNKSDAIAAGAIAGLGLATVAGYLAVRRVRNNRVTTAEGEEVAVAHQPAQYMRGMASAVKLPSGEAVSFPADADAEARLRAGQVPDAGSFIMDAEGGVTRNAHEDPRYGKLASWAIGVAQHVLPSFMQSAEQEQLPAPPPEA